MISNQNYIELFIQGQLVEFESQDSLNLRINNVIFNPTKTATKQAEYSYSFDIPSTPNNDKIFGYANTLSRINKFHTRYSAELYADGNKLFDGSLTINKYKAKDKIYECNLVSIKVSSLEDIFGDDVLTDCSWNVPYEGAPTINSVNDDASTKYFFPTVCYGAFAKDYKTKDTVGFGYTPKHDLDKYNKWRWNDFYPSLNVLETVKRLFEWKGYTVGGTAFSDPQLNNIYASCNLAEEQIPEFNLGFGKFGHCEFNTTFTTDVRKSYTQDLSFPYAYVKPAMNASNSDANGEYNFSTIRYWSLLNKNQATVTTVGETYMYDPSRMMISITQSGWYHVNLQVNANLSGTPFNAYQYTTTFNEGDEFKERAININPSFGNLTPFEIQLVRNVDNDVELIKGKWNVTYDTGDPNQETYTIHGGSYTGSTLTNKKEWFTSYPHEENMGSVLPTKIEILGVSTVKPNTTRTTGTTDTTGTTTTGTTTGGRRAPSTADYSWSNGSKNNYYGYIYEDGQVMPYDCGVNPKFICGFSSLGNGSVAVMRDGASWSRLSTNSNKVLSETKGLTLLAKDGTTSATSYSYNSYRNANKYISKTDNHLEGNVDCCIWLEAGDLLELLGIQRYYNVLRGYNYYSVSGNASLSITAISTRSEDKLRADPYFSVDTPSELPQTLNLFNFTNNETKVSEWIDSIAKAFNLEITVGENQVSIDTNQGIKKTITNTIDIDDRVSSDEAEAELISYPKEMSVQYKTNTDEYGFELTVSPDHIDDTDWDKWGDSGYTIIQLSDDTYETNAQNTPTQISYTYYDNFVWKEVSVDSAGTRTETGVERQLRFPTIELSEYMAEGFNYEDAMYHDGYSLSQRFWFRQPRASEYINMTDNSMATVYLCYPTNSYNDFNLSYKDTEKSIVTEYFNIFPMLASNYVTIEVNITPQEYNDIKRGALVHFDSDLYYTSEISGFDPSGKNPTKLKLIKKV